MCWVPRTPPPTPPHTAAHTLPPTLPPFENLKAHAAVVVWAFPEAGAVVGGVGGEILFIFLRVRNAMPG